MPKKEDSHKELIVLVGPPGSGKTTLCNNRFKTFVRISQDDLGKEGHLSAFLTAIKTKPKVVVDRMNHTRSQRARYIEPAKQQGFKVKIIVLNESYDVCLERMKNRTDHPTIKSTNEAVMRIALGNFFHEYEDVLPEESA